MYKCPNCGSEYGYFDNVAYNCPECGHMWTDLSLEEDKVLDANGNELKTGDSVVTIKDLKFGKDTMKRGTKITNIRILDEEVNGHDIDAKTKDFGGIYLKSSVVKKLNFCAKSWHFFYLFYNFLITLKIRL